MYSSFKAHNLYGKTAFDNRLKRGNHNNYRSSANFTADLTFLVFVLKHLEAFVFILFVVTNKLHILWKIRQTYGGKSAKRLFIRIKQAIRAGILDELPKLFTTLKIEFLS